MNAQLDTMPRPDPLEHARELLDGSAEPLSLNRLAAQVGLSPAYLQRSFRRRFGVSPAEYLRARRFSELKANLRGGANVTDAVYAAGFGSSSRVYEHADRLLGMPPARYRDGGAGVAIRYTTARTPLGRVLVAATARGICAVTVGDDDEKLLAELRAEFPQAELTRVDAGRDEWLAVVLARVAADMSGKTRSPPDAKLPPIDVTATAFQWRVWQELTRIPAGETRSYADIARSIGEPKAARAVGHACGSNKLAFIVPCHRVVRADGTVGGWRWGVARKRELLESESRFRVPAV
ncbi:MAG: Methylated-DNA--protein-cysteine methyltransferase [Rhodanobacteraceae bacterium]|jgi:AraC family transcriptional regulator of adaptative response/methylated-DNA-[protein]-cysteine methyltransferase|nr:MAG: Methylated-DNA--protein-cysteine methyltransferase [Rhodanobacteraceae bacterium]